MAHYYVLARDGGTVCLDESETEVVQCSYVRKGPRVGRRVVTWIQDCERRLRVEKGTIYPKCWQHR